MKSVRELKFNRNALISMTLIFAYYLFTRVYGISGHMNEYFDYDEGTYLMIARLINHGYLPYRDIFAVHPPLFYYLLALWLRVFGDNYVVGRLFSVFLGSLSLIVAYYVGREARNWKLGVVFAGLLAMDPLLIHVNPLVFHETSIEFFTLLSLYYFVRYTKERNLRHAYISLFWAGLGSTLKFTIIPYLLALYLVIVLSLDEKTWKYLRGASDVLLNKTQVFIVAVAYISITLVCVSAIMLYPTKTIRDIMIVPGIHAVTLNTHLIPILVLLTIWGLLTVYIFRLSYVHKLFETLGVLVKNLKAELKLAFFALIPKIIIEGFFGVAISRNYISQTYMAQGGRFLPLLNLFYYVGGKFGDIHASKLEFLVYDVPLMVLFILVVLALMRNLGGGNSSVGGALKILFMVNFFVYFFLSPTIANPRFLYPMTLVLYLLLLDFLFSLKVSKREVAVAALISLVFLSAADFGMLYWFPTGKLKLAWSPKTKTLRDDLREYIKMRGISSAIYYSINPMNAYYLDLTVDPWSIDTFGLITLHGTNGRDIISAEARRPCNYVIASSWLYAARILPSLSENLDDIISFLHANASLEYADSYASSDVIEVYGLKKSSQQQLSFSSYRGKVAIWLNGSIIAYINVKNKQQEFNYRTKIIHLKNGTYSIIQYSNNDSIRFFINLSSDGLLLDVPSKGSLEIGFTGKFIAFYGANDRFNKFNVLRTGKKEITDRLTIFTDHYELEIQGGSFLAKKTSEKQLEIIGEGLEPNLKIKLNK